MAYLRSLKSDPGKLIVAAITGNDEPVAEGIDPEKDELWDPEAICVDDEGVL